MFSQFLNEKNGKQSSTRAMAVLITLALIGLAFMAALAKDWETVRSLSATLALLAGALYGINKTPEALSSLTGKTAPDQPPAAPQG